MPGHPQTTDQHSKTERLKGKRQAILKARLAKIRQRKIAGGNLPESTAKSWGSLANPLAKIL
ncbi:hypothetical protein PAMP_012790 [Pampus punctatissimus]